MKTDKENADFRRACFKWAGIEGVSYPLKKASKSKPKYEKGGLSEKEYMNADEAMRVLGVTRSTLSYHVSHGRLQQEKRIGRSEKNGIVKSFFTRESVLKLKQELEK